ncbi:MAG: Tol biopolymer transporter periplasmic protein [Leptolyngbyaceae cyanobacterium bins.302]|nr:Tol biopolymer transporter periplasmic protein [Leptolyngbyaceae cyanobacterium bins.302]
MKTCRGLLRRFIPVTLFAMVGLLGGCAAPRLINFPYDPGGRSLNSQFSEQSPAIAGRYIVFTSDRRNSQDIYLYDTVTRNLIETPGLNAIDMIESNPSVSDNGRYIAFSGSREGRTGIYLYDRETRQLRNLTENLRAQVRNPAISADGNAIAFESSANGQWDILIYNRFGQPISGMTPPF